MFFNPYNKATRNSMLLHTTDAQIAFSPQTVSSVSETYYSFVHKNSITSLKNDRLTTIINHFFIPHNILQAIKDKEIKDGQIFFDSFNEYEIKGVDIKVIQNIIYFGNELDIDKTLTKREHNTAKLNEGSQGQGQDTCVGSLEQLKKGATFDELLVDKAMEIIFTKET